ncbi:sulfide/dihydroorotate dehydrogenase-like FAD/NAD-binding protein [Catenisphaera adipataccumulans]|uniref:Ferredoxin--NADP+ reductase n=1 Tax=Catenisphaera adipataccumulans TaxID=700500 RepID=A0A7W8FUP9_9FIRM|nr:sulfide/dihydroorotate dehydrogenase-like FAD/NAD-binding protein [Catenisphaera adipataccumulans]MBB5182799.1 ferredoxin--NADP+ reductase [Catenisphaera adipataccumulans]
MYTIRKKQPLNPTVTKMVIDAPFVAKRAKAGQFIILRVNENGERIPLTIEDSDPEKGTVSIVYQIVGGTTMKLNALNEGDSLHDFVGPLGKPSVIDGNKKVCVIGGGVGCAIAYPTAKAFAKAGADVTTIVGFRNKDLVILQDEFKSVSNHYYLTSDDGTAGEKGLVTNKLEDLIAAGEHFDEVVAIGPIIMMKFVCLATKKYDIPTVVSMNPIMIDGTGMCGCCRLMVDGKMKFACVDGPDFDGHLVDFDEAMSRNRAYMDFEKKARDEACNLLNKEVA